MDLERLFKTIVRENYIERGVTESIADMYVNDFWAEYQALPDNERMSALFNADQVINDINAKIEQKYKAKT